MNDKMISLMSKLIDVSNKLKKKEFNTVQDGLRLSELKISIMQKVMHELYFYLSTVNPNFLSDHDVS